PVPPPSPPPSAPLIPTVCDGDGELGCYRIAGDAAEHDLAVAAAHADATIAGDGADLLLQIAGVDRDLHVEHADQLHALIKYRDVGGADLLALNVEHAIRHRQRVHDVGRSDHSAGERLVEPQRARFVKHHDNVPRATTLFTYPRLRLSGAQGAGPEHEQR